MSNKRKVYFRTDASNEIGYGHFTRSLALAKMLKDDFDCTFFTQTPTDYQIKEVGNVCNLVSLPSDDSKFSLFLNYLEGDEFVFLDNYFFTPEYELAIKNKGCKLVTISPNGRHHYADVLLNFSNDPLSDYDVEPYTTICNGIQWTILRTPFLKKRNYQRNTDGVVISFGGTDQLGITEKVVNLLCSNNYFKDIHIIATNLLGDSRIHYLKSKECAVHINISADEVAELFSRNSIAILSTSTVTTEALSQGIKVIAGYYVDNQFKFHNYLSENHFITSIGNLSDGEMPERLKKAFNENCHQESTSNSISFATKEQYLQLFKSL